MATTNKVIKFLSEAYHGSIHDYAVLKRELDPEAGDWFGLKKVMLDLGFIGVSKDFKTKNMEMPKKKSKLNPLTEEDKIDNQTKSSKRVVIEHSIGGFKRFRFLSDRLRAHDFNFYNTAAIVCAGLWNYSLTH